jgi:hypothetical protein
VIVAEKGIGLAGPYPALTLNFPLCEVGRRLPRNGAYPEEAGTASDRLPGETQGRLKVTVVLRQDRVAATVGSGDVPEDLADGDGTVGHRGYEPPSARRDDDVEGQVGLLGNLFQGDRSLDWTG